MRKILKKKINPNPIIISIFLIVITHSLFGQNKKSDFTKENSTETIWIPSENDESYQYKVSDTSAKKIFLIFEQEFDDSVEISMNGKKILAGRIRTNENMSVVDNNDQFKISYGKFNNPIIEICLYEKKKWVSFSPKKGYQLCYISRIDKNWNFLFSNYIKMYY